MLEWDSEAHCVRSGSLHSFEDDLALQVGALDRGQWAAASGQRRAHQIQRPWATRRMCSG